MKTKKQATEVNQDWYSWVQENIKKGCDQGELAKILTESLSLNLEQAKAYVSKVATLPKLHTTKKIESGMQPRRDWMLRMLDSMNKLNADSYSIGRQGILPFADFIGDFYSQNKPVVFSDAYSHWPAANWTPEYLAQKVGEKEVEIQFDRESNPRFELESLRHKKTMPFSSYHKLVVETESSNNFYLTANNAIKNSDAMGALYRDMDNFADGYFDESLYSERSFVWYGPRGNYTPLHHDETNNMFLQVYGRKRFLMIPPMQTPYLYNTTAVFSPVDFRNLNTELYPAAQQATPIEVLLEPGDTLFIPVGWWHQVESLDVSISITITNFNAHNEFPM